MYGRIKSPNCQFKLEPTKQYSTTTAQVRIVAKHMLRGQIDGLCGILVPITTQEEGYLEEMESAFSVIMSSCRKTIHVLLGPARFVNHDCNPNAKLTPIGDKVQAIATRVVTAEQEITVDYGKEYFGRSNCDCLCKSCRGINRSDNQLSRVANANMDLNMKGGYSLRLRR
jgi:histone-lysine N-methyltransferase SUV420H